MAHRTRLEDSWRPIGGAARVRRWLARCGCGWSAGWFDNRTEAATAADEHRQVAALASGAHITR